MTALFAMVALVYGVMILYRAITFDAGLAKRHELMGYLLLLGSVALIDVMVLRQLFGTWDWFLSAALPGLVFATIGLAILSGRLWLNRDQLATSDNGSDYHHGAASCVVLALVAGFYIAPHAQTGMSTYGIGLAALVAIMVGGLLLVVSLAMRSRHSRRSRASVLIGLAYPMVTFVALVAAGLFRLGPNTALSSHLPEVALVFALLTIAGLGAAWLDGRLE